MRLVIFTVHYPFGFGEPFLEDEIRAAEKEFDSILIVSGHKRTETETTRYIPHNAEVISTRDDTNDVFRRIAAFRFLFSPRAIRELLYSCHERGWKQTVNNAVRILLTEDMIYCLEKKQAAWLKNETNEPTVFYSYWLDANAAYTVRHRNELHGLCISRAHGGDCFFDRGYHPYRAEVLNTLDAIFPISEMGRKDILQHYESKVRDLENKVITSRMGVKLPEKNSPQKTSNGRKILCTVSNVIPLKRLDLLIGALAEIEDIDIHWVHFGDGEILEDIKSLARKTLGAKENITYEFRGRIANAEILHFYAEHPVALFVNCSNVEGIPVSVMEAMSYGIPVIARNVGGNAEVVDDTCGRLLPASISEHELADAIRHLLSLSVEERQRYVKSAGEKIAENYCAEKNYSRFYETVKRMVINEADGCPK